MQSKNKKPIKKIKDLGSPRKDKMMVLLESIEGKVKTVAEGHSILVRKIDNLGTDLGGKIDRLELRMDKMEAKMDEGFELVLNHLDGLDKEFTELKNDIKNNYERKGHDATWRKAIEDRIGKLEKLLTSKKMAKV